MAAVGARIDAIEARLSSLSSPTAARTAASAAPPTPLTGRSSVGGTGAFASALAAAQSGAPAATPSALGSGSGSFATLLAGLRPASLGGPAPLAGVGAAAPAAGLSAAALRSHGNGRVPPAALESIGGGERLWAPAAQAFTKMREAARAQGVTLGVNDSYRSFDEQVDMASRKGLYSEGGLAAKPGTSDHGWGKALDLQLDGRAQSWMRANGERFGFSEDTPREPWHWAFTG